MNILVYGGCVTRDAFSLLKHEHKLAGYVARQSLISATSKPAELPVPEMKSAFQQRMVAADLASSLIPTLEEKAAEIDVLVMDTNIERLGVYELSENCFITNSGEVRKSRVLNSLDKMPKVILPSEPRHQELYVRATEMFVDHLRRLGLYEKTLVIDAPMAKVDNTGEKFKTYLKRHPDEVDAELRRFTNILTSAGLRTVTMPSELAVADVDHKWTRSPLHYIEEATQWVADQIVTQSN